MLKFSHQKVGLPVSYIELTHTCVSISTSAEARVSCAVFHDAEDGAEFGSLLSREMLVAFVRTYQHELAASAPNATTTGGGTLPSGGASGTTGTGIFAMDHFSDFQSKIADTIRNSVKPLLDQRQNTNRRYEGAKSQASRID